jgi:tRNA threonylcarbamoyladenosine biosynthesis protein TsaE
MTTAGGELPWEAETQDEAETRHWGGRLAALCPQGQRICLLGDLGAGKTTFTRGLAAGLGADPGEVHSPSYSLVHLYRDTAGRPVLYHVDLYRVEGAVDLEEIGLEDVFQSAVPAAVEWPERLRGTRYQADAGDLEVRLEILGRHRRKLTMRRSSAG